MNKNKMLRDLDKLWTKIPVGLGVIVGDIVDLELKLEKGDYEKWKKL